MMAAVIIATLLVTSPFEWICVCARACVNYDFIIIASIINLHLTATCHYKVASYV